jgi:hypothetical protein
VIANLPELSAEEVTSIVNFLGYGRPSAPVWFIGIEEGLGKMDDEDISANLKARAGFDSTMDLRDAHMRLREQGRPIDIENRRSFTQVWQWMGNIMVARRHDEDWSDLVSTNDGIQSQARDRIRERARQYIQLHLGRCGGDTFLTELSPIPAAKMADQSWKSWFENKDREVPTKIAQRRDALKRRLKENLNALVICYGNGRGNKKKFSEFLEVEWQQVPDCPGISQSRDSKHLLLPFFGNGQLSYAVFVDLIRSGLLR